MLIYGTFYLSQMDVLHSKLEAISVVICSLNALN